MKKHVHYWHFLTGHCIFCGKVLPGLKPWEPWPCNGGGPV